MHTSMHSGGTGNIRHSPRNGFTVSSALSGDRAFLPPSPARRVSVVANLAPASRRQDHTASPYASRPRSSVALLASTASHPTFVTIAIRPSWQGGIRKENHNFLKTGSEIFFAGGLDRNSQTPPDGQISRHRRARRRLQSVGGLEPNRPKASSCRLAAVDRQNVSRHETGLLR